MIKLEQTRSDQFENVIELVEDNIQYWSDVAHNEREETHVHGKLCATQPQFVQKIPGCSIKRRYETAGPAKEVSGASEQW